MDDGCLKRHAFPDRSQIRVDQRSSEQISAKFHVFFCISFADCGDQDSKHSNHSESASNHQPKKKSALRKELFTAFVVSLTMLEEGNAVDAREITMHKHKGGRWLKKIHSIIESIKGQTKGDRAQGPLTKDSIGSTAPVVNKAGILVVQWPGIKTKGKQLDGLVTRWIKKCPANRAKGWSYLCMRAAKGLAAAPAKELTELLTRYPSRAARQETETENYSALPNNTKTVQKKVVHHHLFHGISSQVLQKMAMAQQF